MDQEIYKNINKSFQGIYTLLFIIAIIVVAIAFKVGVLN